MFISLFPSPNQSMSQLTNLNSQFFCFENVNLFQQDGWYIRNNSVETLISHLLVEILSMINSKWYRKLSLHEANLLGYTNHIHADTSKIYQILPSVYVPWVHTQPHLLYNSVWSQVTSLPSSSTMIHDTQTFFFIKNLPYLFMVWCIWYLCTFLII